MKAKVLVAAFPGARNRIASILNGHEIVFANTMGEATAALSDTRYDLILIGTKFDESRMFDLLRYLHEARKPRPHARIVCFRGMMAVPASDKAMVEGVSLSCSVLGASGFYDFAEYANDSAGNAAVRRIFDSHLEQPES